MKTRHALYLVRLIALVVCMTIAFTYAVSCTPKAKDPADTTAADTTVEDTTVTEADTTREDTTAADTTTSEPEDTTSKPEDTTSKPEDTTSEPEDTTAEPEVTTSEPEVTTSEHICSFGDWSEAEPATCTAGGVRIRRCACGNIETQAIPATGHTESAWIVDAEAQPGVNGSKHVECTACHTTLRTEIIPALPVVTDPEHTCSFGAWSEAQPATCTAGGVRIRRCACGNIETQVISATGHTESAWIVDAEAQPGVNGSKHVECTACHTTLRTEIIPALPVVSEPEVTTAEPEATTAEPEATTAEPEATTAEPEVTTAEPETTTEPETSAPTPAEDFSVDISTLPGSQANWSDAGYTTAIIRLGYNQTISLGYMDLSGYSKVRIQYGCDGGADSTGPRFAALNGNVPIGLKSTPTSYGDSGRYAMDGDIAHTDMTFSTNGWASGARWAEIDLTDINYAGNVYVAVHNPESTVIAISGIQFIASDSAAEETTTEPETTTAEPETTTSEPETTEPAPTTNRDPSGNVTFLYGAGTESEPYTISDKAELAYFAANYAQAPYAGGYFKLTASIAWSSFDGDTANPPRTSNWTPIGTKDSPFVGTFDGNGKTVSGIYCTGSTGLGFFNYATGTVKNLTIDRAAFIGSGNKVAAFVANLAGDLAVIGCRNRATVEGTQYVSGIVSFINVDGRKLTVQDCINYGHITIPEGKISHASGILALAGKGETVITGCRNYGTVTGGSSDGSDNAGGIVGRSNGGTTKISRCDNYGLISGKNLIGGIAGNVFEGTTIEYCYNAGDVVSVSLTKAAGVGGIVGRIASGTLSGCIHAGDVRIAYKDSQRWGEIAGDCGSETGRLTFEDVGSAVKISNCYFVPSTDTNHYKASKNDAYATNKGWIKSYATLEALAKAMSKGSLSFGTANAWSATNENGNYILNTPAGNRITVPTTDTLTFFSTGSVAAANGSFTHQDGHVFVYGDQIYIIDGGNYESGAGTLWQYLIDLYAAKYGSTSYVSGKKLNINLIISHFHGDHMGVYVEKDASGKAIGLLADSRFKVVSASYPKVNVEKRTAFESLLNTYHAGWSKKVVDFKEHYSLTAGALTIECFGAPYDWMSTTRQDIVAGTSNADLLVQMYGTSDAAPDNANSIWTRVTYCDTAMLFTGDVLKKVTNAYDGNEPFDVMLTYWQGKMGKDVFRADIVKFPHHGDVREKAMAGVLAEMSPEFILYTSLYKEYKATANTPIALTYAGAYAGTQDKGLILTLTPDGQILVKNLDNNLSVAVYHADGTLSARGDIFHESLYDDTPTKYLAGEGTEASPFLISTADDLAFLAKHYADDRYLGKYFKLTNDIVWNAEAAAFFSTAKVTGVSSGGVTWSKSLTLEPNWTPIGSYTGVGTPFTGVFDGAGYTVSGIYCGYDKATGFFGAVNGTVKNLTVKDSFFDGRRMVAAIVGHVGDGDTVVIENCVNYATVVGRAGVGGIFGGYFGVEDNDDDAALTGSVHITGCVNYGGIYGYSSDANASLGGIVGSLRYMGKSSITCCANYGSVTSLGGCVGGIVGQAVYCDLTMTDCINRGNVKGLRLVGGIVGKISHTAASPKVTGNLINTGDVTATSTSQPQVGQINGSGTGAAGHENAFTDGTYYYLSTLKMTHGCGSTAATGDIPALYTAKSQSELNALIAAITARIPALK